MNIGKQFLYSFFQLKKVSVFRIQKLGKSIGYLFFLMFIALIPILIQSLINSNDEAVTGLDFPLPISLIFLYLFTTSLKFIGVSFLAFVALGFVRYTNRKLQYQQSWILSAYAVTSPTIVFALLDSVGWSPHLDWLLYWVVALFYLYGILHYIPRKKKKPQ